MEKGGNALCDIYYRCVINILQQSALWNRLFPAFCTYFSIVVLSSRNFLSGSDKVLCSANSTRHRCPTRAKYRVQRPESKLKQKSTFSTFALSILMHLKHTYEMFTSTLIHTMYLQPENVLMSETGETKLSDFGLATEVSPPRNKKSAEAYEGSITGMCGTRGYMAPEMYRRDKATGKRKPYTESIDWFAFGCCIVEFMTGSET